MSSFLGNILNFNVTAKVIPYVEVDKRLAAALGITNHLAYAAFLSGNLTSSNCEFKAEIFTRRMATFKIQKRDEFAMSG